MAVSRINPELREVKFNALIGDVATENSIYAGFDLMVDPTIAPRLRLKYGFSGIENSFFTLRLCLRSDTTLWYVFSGLLSPFFALPM